MDKALNVTQPPNPFHAGELEAQARAGAGDVAAWAGGFIRDHMPAQHRDFYTSLPFLVMAGADAAGQTWVTLVAGAEGFITSPDAKSLSLDTQIAPADPLAAAFEAGTDIGVVGIELHSRRRNRFSGHIRKTTAGYGIDIRQTFGNCPQYIHERSWRRVAAAPKPARHSATLRSAQIRQISRADTLFIGSGHQKGADVPSRGYDASHRDGAPGFVHVDRPTRLAIPDYSGNNFFNTIGNILTDERVGLVFVDFETGSLLHVSGRAHVNWRPENSHDPAAWRMIEVDIDAVVERPNALSLRWSGGITSTRALQVLRREEETPEITSFYLGAKDGKPLPPFKAGQHLPVEVDIKGQYIPASRSYSLSGASDASGHYRLSIKREPQGQVSRLLHDTLKAGDTLRVGKPSGDFTRPVSERPLFLVSAGVGLTPMVAMLHETLAQQPDRPVCYIHGTRNRRHHTLRNEVAALIASAPNARQLRYFSDPAPSDRLGHDYDHHGRITAAELLTLDGATEADFMLCGPAAMIGSLRQQLEASGIAPGRIHFETFGPTQPAATKAPPAV